MLRWYAAKTQNISKAHEELKKQGFTVWLPKVEGVRVVRGRILRTSVSLFGAYILVEFDVDAVRPRWQSVNGTIGVEHLLPVHAEMPQALPMREISILRELESSGKLTIDEVRKMMMGYEVGDIVPITGGTWMGYNGILDKPRSSDKNGLPLLLALLGRQIRVTVPHSYVEPAPSAQ